MNQNKMAEPKRGGLLERFLSKERGKIANRRIPVRAREGRILDIGCGEYPYFLLHTDFREKYGVDRLTRKSRNEIFGDNVRVLNLNIEKEDRLPFPDEYFTVVTMLAVFEHIEPERLPKILNEIHRVLMPGGLYIMTTPAAWTDGLLRMMAKVRWVDPVLLAEHKDTYTRGKIRSILLKTRFSGSELASGYFECFVNCWATARKEKA